MSVVAVAGVAAAAAPALELARGEPIAIRLTLPALGAALAAWLILSLAAFRYFGTLQAERRRRMDAARAAAQSDRLAQLTAALGQARTPRAAIEAALQEPLFALRADAGALLLVSGTSDRPEIAREVGYPSDDETPIPCLSSKNPVADAVGRGAPVILESRGAWRSEYPDDPRLARGPFESLVVVPLLVGSRVVAIVRLEFQHPRAMSAGDRRYLAELGARAAEALDRTRQLEYAERSRTEAESRRVDADRELVELKGMEAALRAGETRYRALAARTTRLHALASALSEAVTVDAVTRAVTEQGRIVAGATVSQVTLAAAQAALEHLPQEAREVMRRRHPVFIKSFAEWQERFPESAVLAADGGYESSASMPLLVEGAPIGVVAFHFTAPVNFDDEYRALLMSASGQCAQALERARLYESTQRARAEAEAANRSKDEFVSIVSHELRTPLSAILGWATMLRRGTLDGAKASRALQSICDNATRQSKLIEELLDFARVTSGRATLAVEPVDLRDLIRGVVESMIPTASARGVALELSPVPPLRALGDPRRLEQVFFNTIDNALKFTREGGRVSISIRTADDRAAIAIADDGAGIDPAFLPFVFDRFRQGAASTTRSHGGLGLGMSIARQLVRAHDGDITAHSEGLGRGATFTITLPLAPLRADEAASVDDVCADGPRLDGLRVLVVDDEEDAREIMAHALAEYGARVEVAASVRDAIDVLERAEIDALLADISMPGEDGFSLIRRVRASAQQRVASIPAAAVTALTRAEHRERALAAGFHLHIAKPFAPAQLAAAVGRLAAART
ncbi:MAG: GAF domain-containing protein [Acidobacteria bacterium]|nr:GAF domain-containing protein [Acidobacteriota bacterium]